MKHRCNGCGRFMRTMYVECLIFSMCHNKNCNNYGVWPEEFRHTKKYLDECRRRGGFTYDTSTQRKLNHETQD